MPPHLDDYSAVAGPDAIDQLHQLARAVGRRRVVHVNSTREGGGVAETLKRLVPLMQDLGLDVGWETVTGEARFFQCTKAMHNGLQGAAVVLSASLLSAYEEASRENAERLAPILADADFVFIHDPQPARLLDLVPNRKGRWIWRCHIDLSRPFRPVWSYLQPTVSAYDASIFSLADFAQRLPHPQYLVPPSIDPLSNKNQELPDDEIRATLDRHGLCVDRPTVLQVSRFDRFKDPIGVIRAYRLAKTRVPDLHLVLAGGGATDDPEGEAVLAEVRSAAADDPDIHVLLLPGDAHREINALQRSAGVVMQKSLREGFGLTVTEAMWKGKPVVGGATGGIRLQVADGYTGYLVSSPEGAALRLLHLLQHDRMREAMGRRGRAFVRENFLLTRHLRDYLSLMVGLLHGHGERIVLA